MNENGKEKVFFFLHFDLNKFAEGIDVLPFDLDLLHKIKKSMSLNLFLLFSVVALGVNM